MKYEIFLCIFIDDIHKSVQVLALPVITRYHSVLFSHKLLEKHPIDSLYKVQGMSDHTVSPEDSQHMPGQVGRDPHHS